jgi:hypothetical protein
LWLKKCAIKVCQWIPIQEGKHARSKIKKNEDNLYYVELDVLSGGVESFLELRNHLKGLGHQTDWVLVGIYG